MADSPSFHYRPRLLRWTLILTILLALYQAAAAIRALQWADNHTVTPSLVLPLEVIGGLLWVGLFASVTLALVRKRPHALRYAGWTLTGFCLYTIARLSFFSRADYDRGRLLFLLVVATGIVSVPAMFLILRQWWISRQAREKIHNGQ